MGYNPTTQSFDTIADLQLRKGSASSEFHVLGYTSPGDGGGGSFYWDASSSEDANGGTIFQVSGVTTGRWKRLIDDKILYVEFFGAKGDAETDDYAAIKATFDFAKAEGDIQYIRFQKKTYILETPLEIDLNIIVEGAGVYDTFLFFPYPVNGVTINFPNRVIMKNLTIRSNAPIDYDDNHTGLVITSIVHFEHVHIWNFAGRGCTITGDGAGDPVTNADQSTFKDVKFRENRWDGVYLAGADANIIIFDSCEAVGNGASGFNDNGFLGNIYINCHTAANNSVESVTNRGLCKYNDVLYYCLQDGLLGQPDISSNDWRVHPGPSWWVELPAITEYDPDKEYRAGRPYRLDEENTLGHNQFGTLVGCYSEADQTPSYWSEKCVSIGGDHGSGIETNCIHLAGYNSMLNIGVPLRIEKAGADLVTILNNDAVQLGTIVNESQGCVMQFNNTSKTVVFRDKSSYAPNNPASVWAGPWIGTSDTVNSSFYRPVGDTLAGNFLLENLIFVNSIQGTRSSKMRMRDAAPTTGNWQIGDIVFKAISGAGDTVLGWRCTVSGSPGTWETLNVTIS